MRSSIYWKAIYKDGTSLCQFEENGKENKYPDINRYKLAAFEIRKAALGDQPDKLIFRLYLEPGRRLIYRRRVQEKIRFGKNIENLKLVKRQIVYLVGWQATIGGRNVQDIAYIFEDGHVELAGRWRDNTLYGPIGNPLPCETKCYDEQHFSADVVIVKRDRKQTAADAILVKTQGGKNDGECGEVE